jgi:hypothetical protein
MTPRRLALSLTISLATLMFGSAGAAQAAACTGETWYGPGGNSSAATSGEWGEKEDWSGHKVPESTENVCITVPGTYTVKLIPYADSHYPWDDGGVAEKLTLGASSGSQTLQVLGEAHDSSGTWVNLNTLQVGDGVTVGSHGVLALEATEQDAPNETPTGAAGGTVLLETDTSGQPGHPFVVEGALIAAASSSKYGEEIHSHALTSSGSIQVNAGTAKLYNEEPAISTGSIGVAAGATLLQERGSTFTNEGAVSNSGTTILSGFDSKGKWIQGSKGSISGDPVVIEGDGGLEESADSGPGSFTMGADGAAYLLGTIPKGQTITLADATGQTTLYLGDDTLVNEGTLHLDLPAGDESNTNIEEGNIVNRGTIYATVEGANAKNVIDVALANEPGGVVSASSGTLFDNRALTNDGLLEIAPGALLELVAATLTNGSAGTIAPQLASAGSFGRVGLFSGATVEAGGTLAPTLVGGFTPTSGEEFKIFEGTVKGAFATVSGGFTGDYSHQSAASPYVGVVYGAAPTTNTGPPPSTGPAPKPIARAKLVKVTVSPGHVTIKLSCPAGSLACGATTVKVTVTAHVKKHGRTIAKKVVVASATVSLKAGETATLKLRVNSAGKALLRKHPRLAALATLSHGASKVASEKVTLKA